MVQRRQPVASDPCSQVPRKRWRRRKGEVRKGVRIGALLAEGVKLGLVAILALLVAAACGGGVVAAAIDALPVTAMLHSMAFCPDLPKEPFAEATVES